MEAAIPSWTSRNSSLADISTPVRDITARGETLYCWWRGAGSRMMVGTKKDTQNEFIVIALKRL